MADAAGRERGLAEGLTNLLLAFAVTAISIVAAWRLAATDFAPAPTLVNPGVIFVAIQTGTGASGVPINVDVTYGGAAGARFTNFQVILTQVLPASLVTETSPDVFVALCGGIARHPRFLDNRFQPVSWHQVALPPGEFSSLIGTGSACVYTIANLNIGSLAQQLRQAILAGKSGPSASKLSGGQVLYALPGVDAWPPYLHPQGFTPSLMPRGSRATIAISNVRADLGNVVASPQLPDSGLLQWSASLNPVPPYPAFQYRLSGQFVDIEAAAQRKLFISGAFVGVAGGGLIWFLGTLVGTLMRVRRKTTKPEHAPALRHGEMDRPLPSGEHDDSLARATPERLKANGDALSLQTILRRTAAPWLRSPRTQDPQIRQAARTVSALD